MPKPVYILGISCYYHDSAAVLLRDGAIVFAAQEERFSRKKHDEGFPVLAVQHALQYAGISMQDVDAVGFYEKPFLKFFERILPTFIRLWPRGFFQYQRAMQEWMQKKLWISEDIKKKLGYKGKLLFTSHHESHAASAFFASGFPEAVIVTVDGVGECATTTIAKGTGKEVTMLQEIHYPHSLGLLYSAITYYLGFTVNSAEYKVMGLAPYGQPTYVEQMRKLLTFHEDGSFRLTMEFFTFEYGLTMTGRRMEKLFGQPRRTPESPLTQFHKDVARSLQEVTEEAMLRLVRHARQISPSAHLCLAGGVALNCVANGRILRERLFDDIFIQPAAGDAGGALGVALSAWHTLYEGARLPRMDHVFLGSEYSQESIESMLREEGLPYEVCSDAALIEEVSSLIDGEHVIGWFQGRMEYGPRALGNRSIIADARRVENWNKVNLKIKFRESFRPFAPAVLADRSAEYFDLDRESPFMLLVADVHADKRQSIPAVTHVDGTARIQTIRREQNPRYYDLIHAFAERTGCPVVINTSFNVRGEPIVESPRDAIRCFLNTHMDYLVLGNCLLRKESIDPSRTLRDSAYLASTAHGD